MSRRENESADGEKGNERNEGGRTGGRVERMWREGVKRQM
jgi:hypothetical protein